jgi:hypothetical protein
MSHAWNNGTLEYWNVENLVFGGIDFPFKENFTNSLRLSGINQCYIFLKPIIPLFQYSNIPIWEKPARLA